jgi:hypothetical protein
MNMVACVSYFIYRWKISKFTTPRLAYICALWYIGICPFSISWKTLGCRWFRNGTGEPNILWKVIRSRRSSELLRKTKHPSSQVNTHSINPLAEWAPFLFSIPSLYLDGRWSERRYTRIGSAAGISAWWAQSKLAATALGSNNDGTWAGQSFPRLSTVFYILSRTWPQPALGEPSQPQHTQRPCLHLHAHPDILYIVSFL